MYRNPPWSVAQWSPVATLSDLAISAKLHLKLEHCDISNAFVQSDIGDAVLFASAPKGYGGEGKVLRLKKALYGTKQASRLFQMELRKKLRVSWSTVFPKFGKLSCVTVWLDRRNFDET